MTPAPDIMEKARELAKFSYSPVMDEDRVYYDRFVDLIAAALAEARAVPDGWKLVPVEPTREMWAKTDVDRVSDYYGGYVPLEWSVAQDAYKQLIAAAPNPPIVGGEE